MRLRPFLLVCLCIFARSSPVELSAAHGRFFDHASFRHHRPASETDSAASSYTERGGADGLAVEIERESAESGWTIVPRPFDASNIQIERPVFDLPRCRLWDDNYINGVVATVEGRVITVGELRQEMAPVVMELEATVNSQEEFDRRIEEITEEVLQNMIDRLLIIDEFYRRGYQIPKVEKSVQLDEFVQEKFDGDRLKFTEQLHDFGKSVHRFKKEMEESFVVNIMLNHIRQSRSEISPLQIEKYYEDHHSDFFQPAAVRLLQIYVPMEESSEGDRERIPARLEDLLERLRNGTPFSDLAREAGAGEPTDWLSQDDLREELRDLAFATPIGGWAGPVRLDRHLALICPIERRTDHWQTVAEVQGEIEARVAQERLRAAQERWIRQLRDRAFVKVYL